MNRCRFEMCVRQGLVHAIASFDSRQRLFDALAHTIGGLTRRRRKRNLRRIDPKTHHQTDDRDDDRSLATAWAPGNDGQTCTRRSRDDPALFIGHYDLLALHNHGACDHVLQRVIKFLSVRLFLQRNSY